MVVVGRRLRGRSREGRLVGDDIALIGADVGAVAAHGVGDRRRVADPREPEPALIGGGAEALAFVDRGAAGEELHRLGGATVVGERGKHRVTGHVVWSNWQLPSSSRLNPLDTSGVPLETQLFPPVGLATIELLTVAPGWGMSAMFAPSVNTPLPTTVLSLIVEPVNVSVPLLSS